MNATQLLAHFDRLAEAPDAVPRLRRFILDLAVRGKLVEQDAGDEPAVELLKRLTVGMKKPTKNPGVAATARPSKCPVGWVIARFADVLTLEYGDNLPAENRSNSGEFPVYGSNGVVGSHEEAFVHEPCIVVGRKGSAGALNLCTSKGSCITDVAYYCVPPIGLDLQYTFKMFHTLGLDILGKGIKPGLSRAEAYELWVPIPPQAEQHRIVAKVDELMALCDQLEAAQQERERRRDRLAAASLQRLNQPAADTAPEAQRDHARFHLQHLPRLTTRPEHIKAMRQTFFNLAVCGKLISQDSSDEPAAELLKRMQEQKALLVRSGALPKSKVLSAIGAEEIPSMLPNSWCWTRIEAVCAVIVDCPHSTATFIPSGVICLDTNSFKAGALTPHRIRYVSEATYQERIQRLEPQGGDLIFAREGSVGESVIVPQGMRCCLGQRVMLFRPMKGVVPSFFQLALSAPSSLKRLLALHKGMGAKHVNVADMRSALLPLPPLAEQHRIVAKVDELMALCDQLEAQLTTTQTDSRRLLDALIAA